MLGGYSSCNPSGGGASQLLADSRQNSQLLHSAWRGRSLNSSNISYNISSQGGLWMLCVYLTITPRTTASPSGKAASNWLPLSFSPCTLFAYSLESGQGSCWVPKIPLGLSEESHHSYHIIPYHTWTPCVVLCTAGNLKHLAGLSIWKKSVRNTGTIGAERRGVVRAG